MRIATWNINSVRLRLSLLEKLASEHSPDVICLQETKVVDESFPKNAIQALGYEHIEIRGMKSYNGVAVLSKLPLQRLEDRTFCGRDDCRHIGVSVDGLDLHCLYIPAGGDEPDPEANDKFAHKLAFFDELADWSRELRNNGRPAVLTGDFNVAPLETDVWSHKQLLKVVSHTPVETERLERIRKAGGWVDVMRTVVPPEEKLFTWWSYRSPNWLESDRGRRLDHVWASPDLAGKTSSLTVLKDARGWDKPSDHVPVIVRFD